MAKSYFHRGGDMPLLGVTIPEHFADIVARFPDQIAVISDPQKLQLTYSQLSEQIDQVAKGLISSGFGKGDRIGIWSTNNLQWILIQMATARVGAILVNINPAYRLQELEYALKQARVQCLITIPSFKSSHYLDMLVELCPELQQCQGENIKTEALPDLCRIIVYDPVAPDQDRKSTV